MTKKWDEAGSPINPKVGDIVWDDLILYSDKEEIFLSKYDFNAENMKNWIELEWTD